jgi:hypothetical protein
VVRIVSPPFSLHCIQTQRHVLTGSRVTMRLLEWVRPESYGPVTRSHTVHGANWIGRFDSSKTTDTVGKGPSFQENGKVQYSIE